MVVQNNLYLMVLIHNFWHLIISFFDNDPLQKLIIEPTINLTIPLKKPFPVILISIYKPFLNTLIDSIFLIVDSRSNLLQKLIKFFSPKKLKFFLIF